jgi:hypothetical protein
MITFPQFSAAGLPGSSYKGSFSQERPPARREEGRVVEIGGSGERERESMGVVFFFCK